MKDRTVKSKSPWMKFFVISKEVQDDLTLSQIECKKEIKEMKQKKYRHKYFIVKN